MLRHNFIPVLTLDVGVRLRNSGHCRGGERGYRCPFRFIAEHPDENDHGLLNDFHRKVRGSSDAANREECL
jgi:hypothetical protein